MTLAIPMVHVIVAEYRDHSGEAQVLGAFYSPHWAQWTMRMIEKAEPTQALRIIAVPLDERQSDAD